MTALYATGWSLHLPGVQMAEAFPAARHAWARADAVPPDRAGELLGRKGLLAVDPASRLAMCAVHRALSLPPGLRPTGRVQPRTALIACANFGAADAVTRVARGVAGEQRRRVSVMDIPNVSGNIVGAAVALRFGLGGPNLTVCSGTTAGLDGMRLASLLLRTRRADRVVLVGAEHAGEAAMALPVADPPATPADGAACVVLEAARSDTVRQVLVHRLAADQDWPRPPTFLIGRDGFDLTSRWGGLYGAQGVVALALAAHLAADEGHDGVAVCCDGEDGRRKALVTRAASAGTSADSRSRK